MAGFALVPLADLRAHRGLTVGARLLLVILAAYCGGRASGSWEVPVSALADDAGVDVRTIRRWRAELVDAGALEVAQRWYDPATDKTVKSATTREWYQEQLATHAANGKGVDRTGYRHPSHGIDRPQGHNRYQVRIARGGGQEDPGEADRDVRPPRIQMSPAGNIQQEIKEIGKEKSRSRNGLSKEEESERLSRWAAEWLSRTIRALTPEAAPLEEAEQAWRALPEAERTTRIAREYPAWDQDDPTMGAWDVDDATWSELAIQTLAGEMRRPRPDLLIARVRASDLAVIGPALDMAARVGVPGGKKAVSAAIYRAAMEKAS